jgi:hypothetical protein
LSHAIVGSTFAVHRWREPTVLFVEHRLVGAAIFESKSASPSTFVNDDSPQFVQPQESEESAFEVS